MTIFSAKAQNTGSKLYIHVGDTFLTATLVDNSTTVALRDLLAAGDITINMSDYAGMEKVGALPQSLPQNNIQMNTVPGDVILYQGRSFVIYYGTNSWSLTPIGKVDNITASELREILGTGDVTITLSLQSNTTGITDILSESSQDDIFYDLNGRIITNPVSGSVYILNGKKIVYK